MSIREALTKIEHDYPSRAQHVREIDALLTLNVHPDNGQRPTRVPHFLVTGAQNTGKTSLLRAILASDPEEYDYTWIDCTKCITTRSLYEYTLDRTELGSVLAVDEDGNISSEAHSVDNLDSFLRHLTRLLSRLEHKNKILVSSTKLQ